MVGRAVLASATLTQRPPSSYLPPELSLFRLSAVPPVYDKHSRTERRASPSSSTLPRLFWILTYDVSIQSVHVASARFPPSCNDTPTSLRSSSTFWLHGSPCELIGYTMLKLGSKNVALFKGCFCRLFSDIGATSGAPPVSGKDMVFVGIGEPDGVEEVDATGEAVTRRLRPRPNRPERALSVPPID